MKRGLCPAHGGVATHFRRRGRRRTPSVVVACVVRLPELAVFAAVVCGEPWNSEALVGADVAIAVGDVQIFAVADVLFALHLQIGDVVATRPVIDVAVTVQDVGILAHGLAEETAVRRLLESGGGLVAQLIVEAPVHLAAVAATPGVCGGGTVKHLDVTNERMDQRRPQNGSITN